jgi:hypothetical protein
MNKNVRYAEVLGEVPTEFLLRRMPPSTLLASVRAYPEDMVIV